MYKLRSKWRFTTLILLVWGVYCVISLLTPQDASISKYHISPLVFGLLIVSVLLPYLVCWLYAISGWLHLREFTQRLSPGTDRNGFAKITSGLLVLVISIIVPTVVQALYLYLGNSPDSPGWNIFSNYIGILFPLLSSLLMFLGSLQITSHIQPKITQLAKVTTVLFPVALFGIFYLFMIFTNPTRQVSADPMVRPTYFLPDSMIIATIVLPVIANWLLGLLFVLNLEHYSHYSKTINRPALVSFYNGIIILVGITILSQVLASLGSNRFDNLSLGFVLVLVYILLGILTLGFGLIAHGAKKLQPPDEHAKSGQPL
ncbi:MAG TPA: hypothetical protein VLE99_01730 [Candidatus Saccharimonadales bacterium]|nr:hypothetical protein [Candidatus Saccharimonadales bacterium]